MSKHNPIIHIASPSGSGKTTIGQKLHKNMQYRHKYLKYLSKYSNMQFGGELQLKKTRDILEINKLISINDKMKKTMDLYQNTDYYFYLLDNSLVAYAFFQQPVPGIHPVLKEPMKNRIFVWGVETLEQYQRQGYMYKMLSEILDNDHEYFLRVKKDNLGAIKLYQKLGFVFYKEDMIIGLNGEEIERYTMIRNKVNQKGGDTKNIILLDGTSSSGKTTIAKYFEEIGYKHISNDEYGKHPFLQVMGSLPNQFISVTDKNKLIHDAVYDFMFTESKKYDKVIFDDISQDITDYFNRDKIFVIIVYASLDDLIRNIISRRSISYRGLTVFNQFTKRYIKTDNEEKSIDMINRKDFIKSLQKMKYEFESGEKLIEFANMIFNKMEINDDNDHYIKLRDNRQDDFLGTTHNYQYDYILKTSDKTPEMIYKELIKILW